MKPDSIRRAFFDVSEQDIDAAERTAQFRRAGFGKTTAWEGVLESRLILLLAEAQSGKTYECQQRQREMWAAGQAAFYVELASVGRQPWRQLLSPEETERLERWRRTETEVATIFMDSYDELILTQSSFRSALRNVANELHGHMARVRIVLTSRPLPVDRKLFLETFAATGWRPRPTEDDFAMLALGKKQEKEEGPPEIRYVSLLPLGDRDVVKLAAGRGIEDTEAFLQGLRDAAMIDFMRRPQDVIEAAAAWHELGGSFGTHADQLAFDVRARLKQNADRQDRDLANDRALEGAKRLALAVALTQRLTIRHNVNHDVGDAATVVDPVVILTDWSDADRKALLERSLFGYASYGRVRFHNTLAVAFLAAERLSDLLDAGRSRKVVRRLLAVRTRQGFDVIRPSLREVAAWLALQQRWVFELVNDLDPALLMNLGDPGTLSTGQRRSVLSNYVERFGKGGWRGLSVPAVQIHRFADQSLGNIVKKQFDTVENSEVRQVLLDLIAAARLADCSELARRVVWSSGARSYERLNALDALLALNDPELFRIAECLREGGGPWDQRFVRFAICRLFPERMTVDQFVTALSWISETRSLGSELSRNLPPLIGLMSTPQLEELRAALTPLVQEGLRFEISLHVAQNDRPHLVHLLAAVCSRLLAEHALVSQHAYSAALAATLARGVRSNESVPSGLASGIASAALDIRAAIFDEAVGLLRNLRPEKPRIDLLIEVVWRGILEYQLSDATWVRERVCNRSAPSDVRAAALLVDIHEFAPKGDDRLDYLSVIRSLVEDDKVLAAYTEERLRPHIPSRQERRWRLCDQRRRRQQERRMAKDRASWVLFWRELSGDPDMAFGPDQVKRTAWNLWRVMKKGGARSRSSGWDRQLIEEHLGKDITDRLRAAMLPLWRAEVAPLESERPVEERSTYSERWILCLAAVTAEAEDPRWVEKLTPDEVERAVRYAPWNSSGFPAWLDALAARHPDIVERLLGKELSWVLSLPPGDRSYSMLFQNIEHASPSVAKLFLPRLRSWLTASEDLPHDADSVEGIANRQRRAIGVLLKFGDATDRAMIRELAVAVLTQGTNDTIERVWLPTLFAVDPEHAVARLETLCASVEVTRESKAVVWIARLFGGFDHDHEVSLAHAGMTPSLLLRLLRLAYHHVERGDDAVHEGGYSPDVRDEAERGRNALLTAVIDLGGPEGWAAKHEIANDPGFRYLSDRLRTLAIEKTAREADDLAMRPEQVAKLEHSKEPGPRSPAEMFALMMDRMDDLSDELLADGSPRELWATIKDERVMRRAIADVLKSSAREAYLIEQEGVTADEKETDIRFISSVNGVSGVIELKVGDKDYSGASLKRTISEQLVRKYLAPPSRRAGVLLITRAERESWQHPETGKALDFDGLIEMLKKAAGNFQVNSVDEIHIDVVGLDLTPRLGTEREARNTHRTSN
ncbi:hypothetical protein LOK46_22525 [Methylobacterium sp. NMS14P]|uniref:hypothetical protein n=1 Tax=Methylobacterium sp. NMS14P TaxID=2894310 RepID=UPI00235861A1|nr:hypothetical protein [Methylobacterium sp. NMS14P]WCS23900.1 hypothetical protein LOK46_22525 [Methylobacterium sp. NMS14P]